MENNNNGRGIFYGVIGVATLVVAIIGATFAYFSASVTKNNIVNVGSTVLNLELNDELFHIRTDMIPVETETNLTLDHDSDAGTAAITQFATFPGMTADEDATGAGTCRDIVGNGICSMYQFTIKNPSKTTAQTVVGSFKVAQNTGFENLYYALFKGAASSITNYDVNHAATATVTYASDGITKIDAANGTTVVTRSLIGDAGTGNEHDWSKTLERLDPEEETTYTMVIWLEETGENQEEQGMLFSGGVTFTSDTGGGVTGILSASN